MASEILQDAASVVLEHDAPDGRHFDWLFDPGRDERLWAWRFPMPLAAALDRAIAGHRLADHRRRYLTFEGELSDGRGHVRIVGRGTARLRAAPLPDPSDTRGPIGADDRRIPPATVSAAWRVLGLGAFPDWARLRSVHAARASSGYPGAFEVTGVNGEAEPFHGWLVTCLPRTPDPQAPDDDAREFTPWAYVPMPATAHDASSSLPISPSLTPP